MDEHVNLFPLTLNRGGGGGAAPPICRYSESVFIIRGHVYLYCQIWVQLRPLRTGRLRESL